jgi:hypothetical protein
MGNCRVCTLPAGKFGVELDQTGRCNYCAHWGEVGASYADWSRLKPAFSRRLDKVRGRYEYDALVGLSGGKDSVYVLHKLVSEYKLKVLAFTFENGFLNDYGRRNINAIVERLGVDHIYYQPDRELHRAFYRSALETFGDPCVGCAIPMYNVVLKICQERRIPFFIHGRSPFQMFRNLYAGSTDSYIKMVRVSLEEHSWERLGALHREIDRDVQGWLGRLFPDEGLRERVHREFFLDPGRLTADFAPEFLGYFLFHPYDEEAMKAEIEREVDYRRPSGDGMLSHADCAIHDAAENLFERLHGNSPVLLEAATMLRRGLVSGAQAQEIVARAEQCGREAGPSLAALSEALQLPRAELDAWVERLRKSACKFDCR